MCQHKNVFTHQGEAARRTLGHKGLAAVQRGNVAVVSHAAVRATRQQHAQFLIAFPNGGNGLCQVLVTLAGSTRGVGVAGGVQRIHAATREDVGAGRKAGLGGAAGHEHLHPFGAIPQEQHGGGRACGGGWTGRVKELVLAGHGLILQ